MYQHADGFLSYLNSLTDDLQYTIEYPSHDGYLPYMDILIHADKSTSVYRKPTHINLYVRYNSCAPSSSKDSVIRSLTRRAHILCSPQHLQKELDTVYTTSLQNGHPPDRVKRIMDSVKQKLENPNKLTLKQFNRQLKATTPSLTASFPFHPTITKKIKKSLASHDVKVTSSSGTTLRDLLTKTKTTPPRESTKVLISNLDSKCKAIHQMFPNMRIFISLLLPTTDQQLNYRINEFNDKIQLLINSRSYLYGFIQHHNLLDHEGKLRHDFSRDYQHLKGSGICEFVNSIKAAIIHRKPGSSNTRPNGVTMQSNGSNQSTGRQPTLAAPWASPPSFPCPPPYPPPFPPPYPPAVHVPGWPPMGMHSSPHWIPPVPACPPWPKAPPGHRSPASGYSPFDVGRDAYKVNNSNIQGPSHRQQT